MSFLLFSSMKLLIIIINYFRNRPTKNVYIFTLFVYTLTEPREHQKAVLPRHVVPHKATDQPLYKALFGWCIKLVSVLGSKFWRQKGLFFLKSVTYCPTGCYRMLVLFWKITSIVFSKVCFFPNVSVKFIAEIWMLIFQHYSFFLTCSLQWFDKQFVRKRLEKVPPGKHDTSRLLSLRNFIVSLIWFCILNFD